MKRRKFMLSFAGVVASGLTIGSSNETVGLDFRISSLEDIDPSKVDQVVLNFDKLEVKPQYINSSENRAEVKIKLSIEDGKNKTKRKSVDLVNGNAKDLSESDNLDMMKTSISTDKERVDGSVEIQVEIGDISNTYSQSFSIKSPELPISEGAKEFDLSNGEYQIYAYESDGKFITNKQTEIDILVVAGGGGGGGRHGSGGGAGGLVFVPDYTVSEGEFNVSVGSGGTGGDGNESAGGKGGNSSFNSITAVGGGGGRARNHSPEDNGEGGSGCGGVENNVPVQGAVGVQPNQSGLSGDYGFGNNGGDGATDGSPYAHGGGGGAGEEGGDGGLNGDQSPGEGGTGLARVTSSMDPYSKDYDFAEMFGTNYGEEDNDGKVYFAGGGAGGTHDPRPNKFKNFGGLGGGGSGGQEPYNTNTDSGETGDDGEDADPNTGGGGGGGATNSGPGGRGGNGGSGIVVIRVGPL